MLETIRNLPWPMVVLFCLTLGLAPFAPQPHIVEKLQMLRAGTLVKPLDIFDLFFHGIPWFILFLKVGLLMSTPRATLQGPPPLDPPSASPPP